MMARKAVKILAVYLIALPASICFRTFCRLGGSLLVLMAGDLNAKHVDWNSRLITIKGRLLCDYANGIPV
jgi:hypothetical protein